MRTLTGKEIELDIDADYKVSRIKERVEEKEGIPPVQQRLIYGGKQMYVHNNTFPTIYLSIKSAGESHSKKPNTDNSSYRADDKTAAEYGLEGGNTLHLVLALRGGM